MHLPAVLRTKAAVRPYDHQPASACNTERSKTALADHHGGFCLMAVHPECSNSSLQQQSPGWRPDSAQCCAYHGSEVSTDLQPAGFAEGRVLWYSLEFRDWDVANGSFPSAPSEVCAAVRLGKRSAGAHMPRCREFSKLKARYSAMKLDI